MGNNSGHILAADEYKREIKKLFKRLFGFMFLLMVLICLSFIVSFNKEVSFAENLARQEARVSFERDVLYRSLATKHGGYYVPVTEKTPPNLYLDVPERDITTPSGKKLTLMNPAYTTRQLFDLAQEQRESGLFYSHITSLIPINPVNAPDDWEIEALKEFEKGSTEESEIVMKEEGELLKLMKPLLTEEGCLKCHADYSVGDIRGGISVSLSMNRFRAIQNNNIKSLVYWHVIFGLFCMVIGIVSYRKMKSDVISSIEHETKRKQMDNQLVESNNILIAVRDIQADFIVAEDSPHLFEKLLSTLLKLTKSEYGFIAEVVYTSDNKPYLKSKAITNIAWDKKTQELYNKQKEQGFEFYNLNTLFGEVIKTGEPLFSNDPGNDPRTGGLPDGHPVMNSFSGLPITMGKELIGMIGIANCPGGYSEELYDFLKPFLNTCATLIVGIRNNLKRKATEKELIRSQKELSAVFENNPSLMILVNSELRISKVNAAAANAFNRSKDEMNGNRPGNAMRCLNALDHPEGCGYGPSCKTCKVRLTVMDTFDTKKNHNQIKASLPIGDKNKHEELHINLSTTYIALEDKGCVLVCIEDITERERTKQALEESEQKFRLLVESLERDYIIYSHDTQGVFTYLSPSIVNVLGYTQDEFMGHYAEYLTDSSINKDVGRYTDAGLRGEKQLPYEAEFWHKDGSRRHLEVTEVPVFDNEGNVMGIEGIVHDITERNQVESRLRKSEAHLRTLVNTLPDIVWLKDPDGIYLSCNPRFESFFGAKEDEIVGKTDYDFVDKELADFFRKNDKAAMTAGKPTMNEEEITFADDGHRESLETIKTPMYGFDGTLIGVLGIAHDITERKQSEELLALQKEFGISLSSESDIETALKNVLGMILKIDTIDCGGIYIADEMTGDLNLIVHKGLSEEFIEKAEFLSATSPQVKKIAKGEPIYSVYSDIVHEPLGEIGQIKLKEGLKGIAVIPIMYQNKPIAVINIASHTHDDIPLKTKNIIESTASQIGVVIARIRAETAVRRSQRNFHSLFNSLNDFLFILDQDGQTINYNPVVKKRLGYSDQELHNKHVLEFHPQDRRKEAGEIVAAMMKGEASSCPIPLMTKKGIQIPVDTIVTPGQWDGKDVVFGISRDISERVKMEEELKHRMRLEQLTANISTSFIKLSSTDINSGINNALHAIGEYLEIDRSYIFLFGEDGKKFNNTHEWCNNGIEPQIENLQDLDVNTFPWVIEKLKNDEVIEIANLNDIPSEGKNFKESLQTQDIKSLVLVPMSYEREPFGFIGIDSVIKKRSWSPEYITLLRLLGEMFVNSLNRKYAEEKINLALKEKEVLLSEIHHRVKNNMQVISSLLMLQSGKISDVKYKQMFNEGITRINAMAFIHETLYQSEDFSQIDIKEYLRKICINLSNLYSISGDRIKLNIDIQDVLMNMKSAIPCGLIVNELVSNSFKHAFPGNRSGRIDISISEESNDKIKLKISDDGVGFPENFNINNSDSLGLQIVHLLVEDQLKGDIRLSKLAGVEYNITFERRSDDKKKDHDSRG